MRFLDLHFDCPRCQFQLVSNEPETGRKFNTPIQAVLSKHIGPYDTFAHYHGTVHCPSCAARLSVAFRDGIRTKPPRTELMAVRVLDAEDALME